MEHPELNEHEARVLGVLIEKELTTPDQYPLSLNALGNGCNQKSNRDPVVDFLEAELVVALQGLTMKGLAGRVSGAGSRVEKYRHNARERLKLSALETAVLAELLMRGPQAPGELRSRVNRMSKVSGLEELRAPLAALQEKGLVARLAPGHGSRAERFVQRLAPGLHPERSGGLSGEGAPASSPRSPASDAAPPTAATPAATPGATPGGAATQGAGSSALGASGLAGRVEALEREVADQRRLLERLARDLGIEVE